MDSSTHTEPLQKEDFERDVETNLETDTEDQADTGSDKEPFIKQPKILHDRYNIAYMVFYLLGINTMIPWNFFVMADDYWMYKFREINVTENKNTCSTEYYEKKSDLQASFISYIMVSSSVPNTIFLIVNTFISKKIPLTTRMIGSQCIILIVFIITTTLAKTHTDKWQNAFLITTLASVAVVNAAAAIFGGSLLGIVGRFSPKYITAMSAGQALGGVFTAITEIVSLWIGANPVTSGLLYFTVADTVLFLSLIAYIVLERELFFKHHMLTETLISSPEDQSTDADVVRSSECVSYSRILTKIFPYGLNIFLVFFVTVLVYPSLTVLIVSQGKGHGNKWNDTYFVPVVTYLIFSIGDYTGRVLSGVIMRPRKSPWTVVILSSLRVLFIPAFIFCNALPRHHLPVYIHQDVYYILLIASFSLSNGYLCNLGFMHAPTLVERHEKEVASAMLGAFLGCGFTFGSPLGLFIIKSI